ncbi:hypothetical protein IHE56_15280 [Streptomyces sp. ID01-12c]|nr:hypothetical protein [Streptomyces caniscabiei]
MPAAGTTSTPQFLSYGRPADHRRIAAELRARPGEWATVGIYRSLASARNVAGAVRHASGKYGAYGPAGAFEARTELVSEGTRVEARYIAAPSASTDDAAWADALAALAEEER